VLKVTGLRRALACGIISAFEKLMELEAFWPIQQQNR